MFCFDELMSFWPLSFYAVQYRAPVVELLLAAVSVSEESSTAADRDVLQTNQLGHTQSSIFTFFYEILMKYMNETFWRYNRNEFSALSPCSCSTRSGAMHLFLPFLKNVFKH